VKTHKFSIVYFENRLLLIAQNGAPLFYSMAYC